MPEPIQSPQTHRSAMERPNHEEVEGVGFVPPGFFLSASALSRPDPPSTPAPVGPPSIQRQIIQRQLFQATSSVGSVSILHSLLRGENTSAMRSVARAISQSLGQATESGGEIEVVCVGGGDQFSLTLSGEDASIMLNRINERVSHMEGAAEATAFDTTRSAPPEGSFGYAFNRHFASILPALRQANPVLEGGDDPRNAYFSNEELAQMFTEGQRVKLTTYFREPHMIPDHLFDNGDLGNANTRQRIEIAAFVLANGQIQRGSFTQRMHARMCGHWVELVYNYAAAGITEARGLEFSFDHEGETTMGAGRLEGIFEGDRRRLTPEEYDPQRPSRTFRRGSFPMDRFPNLLAGDWVYVFTDTDTAGGDHSGIFSHWLDATPQTSNGVAYQRAAIFSQRRPEYGGTEDIWYLSDRDGSVNGRNLHTISRVVRHHAESTSPTTVADVEASDLGVRGGARSGNISRTNATFLNRQGRPGHPVNQQALIRYIHRTNNGLLDRLESSHRAPASQIFLWRGVNRAEDLEVLVRLNERINNLVMGAATLERTMRAEHARVDPAREAAQDEADADRERLEGDLARIDGDINRLDAAIGIGDGAEAHRAERRRLQQEISRMSRRLTVAREPEARRTLRDRIRESTSRRAELLILIGEIDARRDRAVAAAIAAEGNWRLGGGRSTREHRNRLIRRRDALQNELRSQDEAGGFHTSHPGGRENFRGEGTGRARLTGLLQNLRPAPAWDTLRESGERSH